MKQTAVEWLHIEFQNRFPKETSEMYNNNQLLYEDMILKAKEMEKQQIIEFAKLHVTKALEAASKSVKYNRPYIEVKDSILNAYPLDKIL